ncbi:response regulator [Sedimenticola selenatireducens]|uniref:Two-component system response regulator n=1 Tax=Sedimenticola selenatireducens TaxID=191960 RepID=A0A2N6CU11_9GAMM|nr:response regulator [Sedimenticola selenatireducens]PLX60618.1 MAG: two-component system response regulator [Sedimenticola selenatireducens]
MKSRILFVDDERHLLDGLKRSLRSQRNVWEVSFADSGEEAVRLTEEQHFDVVVTDMRMPGMNGAELLARLSENYPDMIRLILSGHSDEALILKAVPYAHQFLAKPCDAEVIKHVITRSLKLKSLVEDSRMQALVSQIRSLPTLPELYVELTELLNSDRVSVQKVGEVIGQDPAMVSKILQMVNSAFFGIGHHISSPVHAATMLGIETLRGLVLSAGIFIQFDTKALNIGDFTLEALHRHSLQVSRLAKAIAESMGVDKQVVEDSLLAGLLHDIGKLILVQSLPNEYRDFFDKIHDCHAELLEAERSVFNVDHGRVGAYLLGLWALPDSLVEAVAYHHEPQLSEHFAFSPLLAVHVADALTSAHSTDAAVIPAGLDMTYLEASGVADRLDEWRALHGSLLEEAG